MIILPELMDGSIKFENTPGKTTKSMFYYVQSAGHYYCMPGYFEERENYNSFLILYSIDGKGNLHYRNRTYEINVGQVVFLNCLEKYSYSTNGKNVWETIWVHFNGSETRSYFDMIYKNSGPVINLNLQSNISKNLVRLIQMLEHKDLRLDILNSRIIVDMLTELLLNDIHINMDEFEMPDSVKNAITKIESSFNQQIDLDSLSKEICISKFHLIKLFKNYTGFSPYDYLIKFRINYAKNLLKNTSLHVHKISEEVGFESVSHFVKIFRKYEDITPLKFRMQWQVNLKP